LDKRKDADNVWARNETKFIGVKNCPRIEEKEKILWRPKRWKKRKLKMERKINK